MTDFSALFPGNTYKDLIHLDNSGTGVDATLRAIHDGVGNVSAMQLSTTEVRSIDKLSAVGELSASNFFGTNMIINGGFDIWQRGVTFAAHANAAYSADRWTWTQVGVGVVTINQSSNTPAAPTKTSPFSLNVEVTTLDGTIASTDRYAVRYRLEGRSIARLGFGNASARRVTLHFWARSRLTGVHTIGLLNGAGTRAYTAEYTIALADTWEKQSFDIPGDNGGTWLTTSAHGLSLFFYLASGTDFHGTADAWSSTDNTSTVGQVNVMAATDTTAFGLFEVQLEVDGQVTEFEYEDFGVTRYKCLRYFERINDAVTSSARLGITGWANTTNDVDCHGRYEVTKRIDNPVITSSVAATFLLSFDNTSLVVATINSFITSKTNFTMKVDVAGTPLTVGSGASIFRDGTDTAFIDINAEI